MEFQTLMYKNMHKSRSGIASINQNDKEYLDIGSRYFNALFLVNNTEHEKGSYSILQLNVSFTNMLLISKLRTCKDKSFDLMVI